MLIDSDCRQVKPRRVTFVSILGAIALSTSACTPNNSFPETAVQLPLDQALTLQKPPVAVPTTSAATPIPDTCPDGLVVMAQSTINKNAPFKETYNRQSDGCYITKEVSNQAVTSRAFFGAVHAQPVKNPDIVEEGFRAVVLDHKKSSDFTVSFSRLGAPSNADNRLSVVDRKLYSIKGVDYPSITVDCETTVTGLQHFDSSLTFSRIPGTNLEFLAEATTSSYPVWGAEKVVEILFVPKP